MNSTGMSFAPGARSVCFRGLSLVLMLLSTCSCSGEYRYRRTVLSILLSKMSL